MGMYQLIPYRYSTSRPLPQRCRVDVQYGSEIFQTFGSNLRVTVSPTAKTPAEGSEKSITVFGHLDTGSATTNISRQLAEYLTPPVVGRSQTYSTSNVNVLPLYEIDLSFPGTNLEPFKNLQTVPCFLPFDLDVKRPIPSSREGRGDFHVVIGRDILSKWNVVWDGPTSITLISSNPFSSGGPQCDIISSVPPKNIIATSMNPDTLMKCGFYLQVEVSTPPQGGKPRKKYTIMGRLDTGASNSCISQQLAEFLEVPVIGMRDCYNATGERTVPVYAVDIAFPEAQLKPFENLKVSPFATPLDLNGKSRGVLPADFMVNCHVIIGRDMIARWNVVWNGPSSMVTISD